MRGLARAAASVAILACAGASAEPIRVTVHPIESFSLTGSATEPPLEFLGGLHLTSEHPDFGGFSGAVFAPGGDLILVNDAGSYLRARLTHTGGRLAGMESPELAPLMPGEPTKARGDTEDIALDPADSTRGVVVRERQANAMLSFTLRDGVPADFQPMTVGAENRLLRSNSGLESVDYAPPASPAAGRVIAIAERPPHDSELIPGWIAGVGAFGIVRRDAFDVSSARFLPDGDLLILERRFSPARGIGMRLRRIDGAALAVDARLDGEVLIDAGLTSQIDNMEGLAVSQDAGGRVVLTVVSDDNYNAFQRTLILQFALTP